MLLMLSQWLQGLSPEFGFLRVFQYLTMRAVMAALTALVIGLLAGPRLIRMLTSLKIGQPVRGYGMETHLAKSGTPTMGGALILLSIAVSTLLWFDLSNRFVWIVLLVTLGFGTIGWVDDWRKVVNKDPEGMRSGEKYFWQSVIGLLAALYLVFCISENTNAQVFELFVTWVQSGFSLDLPPKAGLLVPFFKEVSYPLGVLGFVVMTYLVIVGASNAVNLTDGLDGLAIMPVIMVGSALGIFAYVTGNAGYAKYLLFPHIPGSGELLVYCAAMAGAGLAFLWFNAHPAQVFMGDVGALAGNRAGHHGRHLRGRGAVGDAAGHLVQVHQEALWRRPSPAQDGAAAPPFREERLEGNPGRDPLLDHHHAAVPAGPVHAEAEVSP